MRIRRLQLHTGNDLHVVEQKPRWRFGDVYRNLVNTQNNVEQTSTGKKKMSKQMSACWEGPGRLIGSCVHAYTSPFCTTCHGHASNCRHRCRTVGSTCVWSVWPRKDKTTTTDIHKNFPLLFTVRESFNYCSYCNLWRSGHEASHSGTHGPAFPTNGDSQSSRSTISFWL